MTSCYDCEHLGTACRGLVPPMEYKDRMDEFCRHFMVLKWRDQLYKPSGSRLL